MNAVIHDYFLPAYIEHALKRLGRLQVVEFPPQDGVSVRHLQVDRNVLRAIGRELRRRRGELSCQMDLRDREGLTERLSGLSGLAAAVTEPGSAFRKEALQVVPQISGFSPEMIGILLESFATMVSDGNWRDASAALPPNQAAVEFVHGPSGYARYYSGPLGVSLPRLLATSRRHRHKPVTPLPITGMPPAVSNIAAGNVPGMALMLALLAISVGAASLGKNASAEPYFGPRFLGELASLESQRGSFPLSDLMPLVTFPGTERPLLEELIHQGDHLQVTGGLDSKRVIGSIVHRLRYRSLRDLKRRISGHWHKVSFDIVAKECLHPDWIETVALNVALDNSMYDTQCCLSAQQVFVEGERGEALRFAECFIEQMRVILRRLPKGARPHERLREMYHWYENKSGVIILTSLGDMQQHPFFAAYEDKPGAFAVSNALNRSIVIRRLDHLETALPRLLGQGTRRDLLQSCAVAVPQSRLLGLAEILGRAGVNRIVAAGNIWDMRLGSESWDGYLPPTDLISPQMGHWTTISFHDAGEALAQARARNQALLASSS